MKSCKLLKKIGDARVMLILVIENATSAVFA